MRQAYNNQSNSENKQYQNPYSQQSDNQQEQNPHFSHQNSSTNYSNQNSEGHGPRKQSENQFGMNCQNKQGQSTPQQDMYTKYQPKLQEIIRNKQAEFQVNLNENEDQLFSQIIISILKKQNKQNHKQLDQDIASLLEKENEIKEQIQKIKKEEVFCRNNDICCQFQGTLQQYKKHLNNCDYEFNNYKGHMVMNIALKKFKERGVQALQALDNQQNNNNNNNNNNNERKNSNSQQSSSSQINNDQDPDSQAYNQNFKEERTLLVANFPKIGMVELFKKFGELDYFSFQKNDKNLIFFAKFSKLENAQRSLEQLDHTEIQGRTLRVTFFRPKQDLQKFRVFVKGLQTNNVEDIKEFLQGMLQKKLSQVSLLNQYSSQRDASAFVQVFDEEDAEYFKKQGVIQNSKIGKKVQFCEYKSKGGGSCSNPQLNQSQDNIQSSNSNNMSHKHNSNQNNNSQNHNNNMNNGSQQGGYHNSHNSNNNYYHNNHHQNNNYDKHVNHNHNNNYQNNNNYYNNNNYNNKYNNRNKYNNHHNNYNNHHGNNNYNNHGGGKYQKSYYQQKGSNNHYNNNNNHHTHHSNQNNYHNNNNNNKNSHYQPSNKNHSNNYNNLNHVSNKQPHNNNNNLGQQNKHNKNFNNHKSNNNAKENIHNNNNNNSTTNNNNNNGNNINNASNQQFIPSLEQQGQLQQDNQVYSDNFQNRRNQQQQQQQNQQQQQMHQAQQFNPMFNLPQQDNDNQISQNNNLNNNQVHNFFNPFQHAGPISSQQSNQSQNNQIMMSGNKQNSDIFSEKISMNPQQSDVALPYRFESSTNNQAYFDNGNLMKEFGQFNLMGKSNSENINYNFPNFNPDLEKNHVSQLNHNNFSNILGFQNFQTHNQGDPNFTDYFNTPQTKLDFVNSNNIINNKEENGGDILNKLTSEPTKKKEYNLF